jgi:hypothetical protein
MPAGVFRRPEKPDPNGVLARRGVMLLLLHAMVIAQSPVAFLFMPSPEKYFPSSSCRHFADSSTTITTTINRLAMWAVVDIVVVVLPSEQEHPPNVHHNISRREMNVEKEQDDDDNDDSGVNGSN